MKKKVFIFISLVFFIFPSYTFAFTTVFAPSVPNNPNLVSAPDSCIGAATECANSQNPGNCGLPACDGGDSWSKYSLRCMLDDSTNQVFAYYIQGPAVCSIGDKCVSGETGLRSGSCDCGSYSPSVYKYCCDSSGNSEACMAAGTQDTSYPDEGQCPGGYIVDGSRVRSSACTPIITATPTSTPTPTPGTCISGDPCTSAQVGSKKCVEPGKVYTCFDWTPYGSPLYCWQDTGQRTSSGSCCANGSTQNACSLTACTL